MYTMSIYTHACKIATSVAFAKYKVKIRDAPIMLFADIQITSI